MGWPSSDPTKVHLDQTTDDPAQARAELATLVDKVIEIIGGRGTANGVCELDASQQVPVTRLGNAPQEFPTGGTIKTAFWMSAAPSGWTQITDIGAGAGSANDRMLRIVSGAGGSYGGTHSAILNDKVPTHSHPISDPGHFHTIVHGGSNTVGGSGSSSPFTTGNTNTNSKTTGITVQNNSGGSNWEPKHINMILCSKD